MSGGCEGTNGARRRIGLLMLGCFLVLMTLVTIGNAESMISDFAAAGVTETRFHIWTWEITSIVAWLSVAPAIWWAVSRLRPPRVPWPAIGVALMAGAVAVSAWHVGVMILLRRIVYALAEGARYRFEGAIAQPYLYEFRKDLTTYLQFVALALLCQWLLSRVGAAAIAPGAAFVTVSDGAVTHQVPIERITQITAAGNYVEIEVDGRRLLHRATLSATEAVLGESFVRIHRGRLVRRAAIRRIETNQSGDFDVELADGSRVRGSRRYRAEVERRL